MNWHIFAIGKPKLAFAQAGVDEYVARLRPLAPVRVEFVKPAARETESGALLRRSEGMFRIALDERGAELTSRQLVEKINAWEMRGVKSVALLIGGSDGHDDTLKKSADWTWSLSRLTLQHELALVVLLEQIYRAFSIKAGTPYHRD
jgi:23S rRNA (pseudouridine1915-N3)-methyltransferase